MFRTEFVQRGYGSCKIRSEVSMMRGKVRGLQGTRSHEFHISHIFAIINKEWFIKNQERYTQRCRAIKNIIGISHLVPWDCQAGWATTRGHRPSPVHRGCRRTTWASCICGRKDHPRRTLHVRRCQEQSTTEDGLRSRKGPARCGTSWPTCWKRCYSSRQRSTALVDDIHFSAM